MGKVKKKNKGKLRLYKFGREAIEFQDYTSKWIRRLMGMQFVVTSFMFDECLYQDKYVTEHDCPAVKRDVNNCMWHLKNCFKWAKRDGVKFHIMKYNKNRVGYEYRIILEKRKDV